MSFNIVTVDLSFSSIRGVERDLREGEGDGKKDG